MSSPDDRDIACLVSVFQSSGAFQGTVETSTITQRNMAPQELSRSELRSSLEGNSVVLPDMEALLCDWPRGLNPEIDTLHKDVEKYLEMLFPPGYRLQKMRAAKVALFGSSWWPYASFETLRIATYLSIWLFAWDDETDSVEYSSLAVDMKQAQDFRAETVNYIRDCLTDASYSTHNTCSNPIITSFEPVGNALRKSFTHHQIGVFLREVRYFVEMTAVEQICQLSKHLPSVKEYQQRRMGSSAVGICLALTEYCLDMELPSSIMRDDDMRHLWDETNMIISTMNDILSVKKEIEQGQVDSLVPILYLQEGSLQGAVDAAMKILQASVQRFPVFSQQLLARYAHDTKVYKKLQQFIYGCQYACTANLDWSLESGRYKLGYKSLSNNVKVTL